MSFLINLLLFSAKWFFYPLVAAYKIVKIIISNQNAIIKSFLTVIEGFKVTLCFVVVYIIIVFILVFAILLLGGTLVTLINLNIIKPEELDFSTGSITQQDSSTQSQSGIATFDGTQYIIDLSKIDDNTKVVLPAGVFQAGTVKQRAEILMIVQEICARPEITIPPEILLGIWYVEDSTRVYKMPFTGSVLDNVWPVEGDGHEGPFQHDTDAWVNGTYYKGKAFISSLEDPNLSDDERVQYAGSCSYKIAGQSRPNLYCFSDAAYSAAYRFSLTYSNIDDNWKRTPEYIEFGKKNSSSSEVEDLMRLVASAAYYNGFSKAQNSFIPAFYVDILNQHGSIDQWSSLGSSGRAGYTDKVSELAKTTTRVSGDLQSGYTYYSDYATALASANIESTPYAFVVANAGKYLYDGLVNMAKALGATEVTSSSSSGMSDMQKKIVNWAKQWVGQSTFKTYNGDNEEAAGWCALFVGSAWCAGGLPYPSKDAQDYPHNNKFTYNSDGTIDYSNIPIGASIVYKGSPMNGVIYGHVALYIGDGKIIEAGATLVQENTITTSNSARTGLVGWGVPSGLDTTTTSSSSSSSASWEKLYSVMKTAYGKPYSLGTCGPDTFDCSGYVWWAFTNAGLINWSRTSAQSIYYNHCTQISKADLKPGDVIFYSCANSTNAIDHIAIYVNSTTISHTGGNPVGEVSNVSGWSGQPAVAYGRLADLGN